MDFKTLEPKTACTPGPEHFQICEDVTTIWLSIHTETSLLQYLEQYQRAFICKREQEKEYKDAKGEKHGNWMRYVNYACNNDEQNLVAFQHQGGILYRCCRPINPGQELLLLYKADLAEDLSVTSDCLNNKKCTDNELNVTQEVISCSFCQLSHTSQVDLDRHVKKCHCPEHEILPKSEGIKHENPILSTLGECVTTPVDDEHGTFQNVSVKKEEPDDQDPFFCELCRTFFTTECNVHGPPIFVPDTPVPLGVTDRAIQSLPFGLEVRESSIPDVSFGVFNKGDIIPIDVHFGPYQREAMNGDYSVAIYKREQENEYKDAKVEKHGNWMRYVNCARNNDEQNLVAFQHQGGILYRCCRPINPGQELLLSYKAELAEDLSVTSDCLNNKKCTDDELNGTWPVSCSFCQLSCTSQVDLDRHVKRCHSPEYEIEHDNPILTSSSSRQCGKFQMPTNIKVHCCSVCGKRFTQKSHLQLHQHIHTGEKPYLCMQCGKNFTQQSSLQLHQRIHRGDKLYPCMQCLKNFNHQSSLQRHQRIHTGEKPYHCTQCGKNFTHLYYLQQHQRIHTGEKPYQCTQCGKNFTHQSNFQRHQRIHIGAKPYHCSECGKNFTHQSNFQRHQRIHTGEKP